MVVDKYVDKVQETKRRIEDDGEDNKKAGRCGGEEAGGFGHKQNIKVSTLFDGVWWSLRFCVRAQAKLRHRRYCFA